MARRLLDAGADLVIGHHTHTPQPVEQYGGGLIAYSLGNFVFDSREEGGRHGLVLRCALTRQGVRDWQTMDVRIERARPAFMEQDAATARAGGG
jgi:poly-gamma-glutamate synthesis protein (capsule biosynthesis protein)